MPRFRALFAATCAVALVACRDLTGTPASLATFSNSALVYPLNGAPPGAPNALAVSSGSAVVADNGLNFDLAFDLDSTGRIRILPLRLVASQLASVHSVALQPVSAPFDSLTRAPKTGYKVDSALVVSPGQTTAMYVDNALYCYGSLLSTKFYAKMVVDSVDVHHALHVRVTVDPNCGFYTLTSGVVPKD